MYCRKYLILLLMEESKQCIIESRCLVKRLMFMFL